LWLISRCCVSLRTSRRAAMRAAGLVRVVQPVLTGAGALQREWHQHSHSGRGADLAGRVLQSHSLTARVRGAEDLVRLGLGVQPRRKYSSICWKTTYRDWRVTCDPFGGLNNPCVLLPNPAMSSKTTLELYSEIASDLRPLARANYQSLAGRINKALADPLTAHGVERLASERRARWWSDEHFVSPCTDCRLVQRHRVASHLRIRECQANASQPTTVNYQK
jgi:hypothetical protein